MQNYPDILLCIGGAWRPASNGATLTIENPATGEKLGQLSCATHADLEAAVEQAEKGFAAWRAISAFDRSRRMRRAADILRERVENIAWLLTKEQGKPLAEAQLETMAAADIIDWFAEEARRTYGRVIPARLGHVAQFTVKEPVGPVAAFSPWNFPINQAVRKVAAALAAGCSIVLKGPEETPASCAELIRSFSDAGIPAGAVNLVFGKPSEISDFLISHPAIRKISFTGSTDVGKRLAGLAGMHMKRMTMELGGHAPALICADADIAAAARSLSAYKFRNAGQVCVSPTRFLVEDSVFEDFRDRFVAAAKEVRVGDGIAHGTTMGLLANARRVEAMERLTADAIKRGAQLQIGGNRIGNKGNFFAPTVLCDVPKDAQVMNEEPFGPLAIINRFIDIDEAVTEANRLPYGLAAYVYTRSAAMARKLSGSIESGMVSINHQGLGLPETPFGGIKDSGYGSEGGAEAVESYLLTKFVTHASI